MGRHSEVQYWPSKQGFYSTMRGKVECLRKCPRDDRPDGPDYVAALARFTELLASGPARSAGMLTSGDVVRAWLDHLKERGAASWKSRDSLASGFLKRCGAVPLDRLTNGHVFDWVASRRSWRPTTRGAAIKTIKLAFNWAFKRRDIRSNPLADLYVPPAMRDLPRGPEFLLPDDLVALLLAGAGPALRDVLVALRDSGARPVEIIEARRMHFLTGPARIVYRANAREGYRGKTADSKRYGDTSRTVRLSPEAEAIVRGNARRGDVLFPAPMGGAWSYDGLRMAFNRLRDSRPVRAWLAAHQRPAATVILYGFRHTWITRAVERGLTASIISELVGTSASMIDKHYCHVGANVDLMNNAFLSVL